MKNTDLDIFQIKNYLIAVILSASLMLLTISSVYANDVWKSGADYVAISENRSANKNDHPVNIDASDLYQIFNNIRVKKEDASLFDLKIFDSKDDYSSEIFTRGELISLSKSISQALSRASDQQDVVFSITGPHEKTLGKSDLTTTGRVFYVQGKLNIIIGKFRVNLAQKYRRQGGYSDVSETIDKKKLEQFRLDVGGRKKSLKPDFSFLTDDYQETFLSPSGKVRGDWLLIDVEQALIAYSKPNEAVTTGHSQTSVNKDYQQLESKIEQLERKVESKESNTFKAVGPSSQSLEMRLEKLKSLHAKGLIDDDSYKLKVQSLLDEI